MPIGLAPTRRRGHSRLSWLAAGARSAEHLRRRMARSGRTLSGQKLWTVAEVKHLRRFHPDYREACAAPTQPKPQCHQKQSFSIANNAVATSLVGR
jgi:hypothetical protein